MLTLCLYILDLKFICIEIKLVRFIDTCYCLITVRLRYEIYDFLLF